MRCCGLCGYDYFEQELRENDGMEAEESGYYNINATPRWKTVMRRARRRMRMRRGWWGAVKPPAQAFQYDALSYALNFDERNCWQEQGLLHTSRFSGPL